MLPYNGNLNKNAKALRKGMTPEEKHLWYDFLKRLPLTVRRQFVIENYIVDFYIPKMKPVIELDGRQHLTREHRETDATRDFDLSAWGISVLRFPNQAVNDDFNKVAEIILSRLGLTFECLKR